MKTFQTKLILLLLPFVWLSACTGEDYERKDFPDKGKNEADIRITLQMPAAAPNTYAISGPEENGVDNITILSFKPDASKPSGWAFAYSAEGTTITDVTQDGSKKQFTVTLFKDNTKQQCLVVLANAQQELSLLGAALTVPGGDKDAMLNQLVSSNTDSWNANNDNGKEEGAADRYRPFPMWGEVTQLINDATTEISSISVLRAIARMDVILADAVTNFSLSEVYVYNSKNKGMIVPAPANRDGNSRVVKATVPAGDINNNNRLQYDVPPGMERLFDHTIYLYEAKAVDKSESSKATCMVLGGTYGSDGKPTYYRIDFFEKNADGTYIDNYRDILRNHRYSLNILSVSGRGFDTPDDAFNAKPINMVIDITDWDDYSTDITYNGQYYLKVSKNPVILSGDPAAGNKIIVKTDFPDGWTATIPDADQSWFTLHTPSGVANADVDLIFDVTSNLGAATSRQTVIRLKAGNLTKDVTVIQGVDTELALDVLNNGQPVDELVFLSQNPTTETLQISWKPTNIQSCKVTVSGGSQLSMSPAIPGSVNSNGDYLNLLPTSISAGEITANPFVEKESIVTFTITDPLSGKKLAKSILLSQTNYALIVDPDSYSQYVPMDGKNKTFMIKSNLPWEAVISRNDQNFIPAILTSGNASTTYTAYTYKVIDDIYVTPVIRSADGAITFSSVSTNPMRKFDNVVVPIHGFSGYRYPSGGSYYIAEFQDERTYKVGWSDADKACKNKIGGGWYLPTITQLEAMREVFKPNFEDYGIDTKSGIAGAAAGYWSSTDKGIGKYVHNFIKNQSSGWGDAGATVYWVRCTYGPLESPYPIP